jgi:hypothetical protein
MKITFDITNKKDGSSNATLQFSNSTLQENVNKKRLEADDTALQHGLPHVTITDRM